MCDFDVPFFKAFVKFPSSMSSGFNYHVVESNDLTFVVQTNYGQSRVKGDREDGKRFLSSNERSV